MKTLSRRMREKDMRRYCISIQQRNFPTNLWGGAVPAHRISDREIIVKARIIERLARVRPRINRPDHTYRQAILEGVSERIS